MKTNTWILACAALLGCNAAAVAPEVTFRSYEDAGQTDAPVDPSAPDGGETDGTDSGVDLGDGDAGGETDAGAVADAGYDADVDDADVADAGYDADAGAEEDAGHDAGVPDSSTPPDASPDHVGSVWCQTQDAGVIVGCDGTQHIFTVVLPTSSCPYNTKAIDSCTPGTACTIVLPTAMQYQGVCL